MSKASTSNGFKAPIIMICGPKSSGKSTFAKLLTNKLWATPPNSPKGTAGSRKTHGVAYLDLDPGQPEYSPPGQISLIHVQEPNFGPSYAHPVAAGKNQLLKSHTIGALSPSLDPNLYMECVLDLFMHYRSLLSRVPGSPLVVNTPGWILGTGLEILTDLISKLQPSTVVYMSQDGPEEVVESLREAALPTSLVTLPSQTGDYVGRTAAHLRLMQYMSYFHLDTTINEELKWNGQPLTSIRPWEIKYSGNSPGILGIMCYGEQPPADMLGESIDGSILAVVILDSAVAIRGLNLPDSALDVPSSFQNTAFIVRTPDEDLPYFSPDKVLSLNPEQCQTVGLALVRGIDIRRRRLQILTPISQSVIEEAHEAKRPIVLVSGKFDTPGWAYTEDLIQKLNLAKTSRQKEDSSSGAETNGASDGQIIEDEFDGKVQDPIELESALQESPWVEKIEGSQSRGVGARVWRVRRDLGKSGG